jgi:hypothetical protein
MLTTLLVAVANKVLALAALDIAAVPNPVAVPTGAAGDQVEIMSNALYLVSVLIEQLERSTDAGRRIVKIL